MKKYILILLAATFAMSCSTQKASNPPISTTTPVASNSAFFNAITAKNNFEQVKINSKVNVENGSFVPTLDATIYIENDKKVWMNMVALVLNVGRGIATPDGIKGYEKWNKTYIESDFTYLNKLLNVNFINFNSLQNLLMGRTFIPVNEKDFTLTKNAQGYQLTSVKNMKVTNDGKTSEYTVVMDYSSDFDLTKVNLKDIKTQDNLEVSYGNWVNFENTKLPKNVKIIIKGEKNGQVLIENTKFDFSKMQTPYSVPTGYTKVNIR